MAVLHLVIVHTQGSRSTITTCGEVCSNNGITYIHVQIHFQNTRNQILSNKLAIYNIYKHEYRSQIRIFS